MTIFWTFDTPPYFVVFLSIYSYHHCLILKGSKNEQPQAFA